MMNKNTQRVFGVSLAISLSTLAGAQTNTFPTSGNTGIGTTSPATKLHVIGAIRVANTTDSSKYTDISTDTNGYTGFSNVSIGNVIGVGTGYINIFQFGPVVSTSSGYFFSNNINAMTGTQDTGIYRLSAGKIAIGNATVGNASGTLVASNLGIGTASPVTPLEVAANSYGVNLVAGLRNSNGNESGGNAVGLGFLNEGSVGAAWWKAAIVHERLGGYGVGSLHFLVDDRITNSPVGLAQARMTITAAGNVGIGTTNPTQKLSVNGTIRAKEVIVDTGWSDYVFASDYRLAPLSEVETHIKANGHLPGIPSAKEVAEHGVSMGEMQSKLLAKIEELTLHQIEQEKKMQAQESRLNAQAGQLEQLRQENQSLRDRLL